MQVNASVPSQHATPKQHVPGRSLSEACSLSRGYGCFWSLAAGEGEGAAKREGAVACTDLRVRSSGFCGAEALARRRRLRTLGGSCVLARSPTKHRVKHLAQPIGCRWGGELDRSGASPGLLLVQMPGAHVVECVRRRWRSSDCELHGRRTTLLPRRCDVFIFRLVCAHHPFHRHPWCWEVTRRLRLLHQPGVHDSCCGTGGKNFHVREQHVEHLLAAHGEHPIRFAASERLCEDAARDERFGIHRGHLLVLHRRNP
mmetsp:Transcript_44823/g.95358  ORF Transcript_44823/g.95358 Transcript_44823/m.95358 type:complete len:257 (+) Transcript_44823:348-1118(+)